MEYDETFEDGYICQTDDLVGVLNGYELGDLTVIDINGVDLLLRLIKVSQTVEYYDYYDGIVIDTVKMEPICRYQLLNYKDVPDEVVKWFDWENGKYLIDEKELQELVTP